MSDLRFARPNLLPPGIKNLLIINGLMFVATLTLSKQIDMIHVFGMFYWTSPYFHWWQPVTHMFMHGGWEHIIFNMFALWTFGVMLENVWGTRRFLVFYFVCGIGAIACQMAVTGYEINHLHSMANQFALMPTPEAFKTIYDHYNFLVQDDPGYAAQFNGVMVQLFSTPHDPNLIAGANQILATLQQAYLDVPVVGASGAIYGVLLGFGMLFPNARMVLLFPPIPVKAKYIVIAYGLLEVYSGFTDRTSNVAHFAHLGGMLFGLILILYWNKTKRNTFY